MSSSSPQQTLGHEVPRLNANYSVRNILNIMNEIPKTARYEATVATGLEAIAQEEIIAKLSAKTSTLNGRVLLETDRPVEELLKLRSINNLFVIVYDGHIPEGEMPENGDQLEVLLSGVATKCDWQLGLSKWMEMSKFDRCEFDQILTKNQELRCIQPNFRVSSYRYGPEHKFTSPEICIRMGNVLDEKFGWPIKMKEFDLEVHTNISLNHIFVTLTLTPISLACRYIISAGYTTLKAATCYALLRVAKVELGDIVLDPMGGSGAIPVENMACWRDNEWFSFSLCSDILETILPKAKTNMGIFQSDNGGPPSDLLIFDVTNGALREGSIDVVVSDLPFGKRHGNKYLNRTLYPKILRDLARITRPSTGRAALLTQDFKSINLALKSNQDFWAQKLCNHVKIGNLECYIYLFNRTSEPYHLLKKEHSNQRQHAVDESRAQQSTA